MARKSTDLRVTIDADAAKLEREIQRTQRSMMRLESQIRSTDLAAAQLDKMLEDQRAQALRAKQQAYESLGKGLLGFGAATLAGLGMATKAAMGWESAWAGVTKTVSGTPAQLAALEKQLRSLATSLPASHQEIAAVAEAAGQLGVERAAVAQFTETMIHLSETTNLTADGAATAIAQLGNVMGTDLKNDVDNFGSALVALGNAGASTERDILEMAQRIGGAGATVGMTEQEVLALASSLSSVGIEAEAGGSAVSRVMIDMASAVAGGGEELRKFAEASGLSAQEFATQFEQSPAKAINSFVTGLGRINDSGQNVFATLEDLGVSEIRVRDALLRMANAEGLLADNIDLANGSWDENTALIKEAEKRYQTAESKIQVAKNTLVDLGIDIGSVVLPVLIELVQAGSGLINWFRDLPGPVKTVLTVLGSVAGILGTAAGGALLLAPRIKALSDVFSSLAANAPKAAAGLRAVSLASGAIGIAMVAAGAIIGAFSSKNVEAEQRVRDLSDTLDDQTGAVTENTRVWAVNELEKQGLLRQAQDLGIGLATLTDAMLGEESALRQVRDRLQEIKDSSVGTSAFGDEVIVDKERFAAADKLLQQLGQTNTELEKAQVQHERTGEAIAGTTEPIEKVDNALIELAARFGLTGDDAEKAAQDMIDRWSESSEKFINLSGAYKDALQELEDKERSRAENAAQATKSEKDSWEDFYNDVSVTIDDFMQKLDDQIKAQRNWHKNMAFLASRVSDEMLAELAELGPEGAPLVQALVDGGAAKLREADEKWRKATSTGTTAITSELAKARPVLMAIAAKHGQKTADQLATYMVRRGVDVETAARKLGVRIDEGVRDGENRKIPVVVTGHALLMRKLREIDNTMQSFKDVKVSITATGDVSVHGPGVHGQLAYGGEVRGPGGARDDRAGVYALSDREWVVQAPSATKYGRRRMAAVNAGLADIMLPGEGGRLASVTINADSRGLDATDFRSLRDRVLQGAGTSAVSSSGKVLPPGSYRIGRGPEGHGYNARDLPAPIGTPIFSAAAGLVSTAARLATSYGIHARLQHAGFSTLYAHMSQMFVSAGQQVARGQMIGRVGSTGNSTGPHLHLEPDLPRLYDKGGIWPSGTLGLNASGGDELVLDPATTAAIGGKGGSGDKLPKALRELRDASEQMVAFANALRRLRRRGLSDSALQTIHDAGPDEGLSMARGLLKRGGSGIRSANRWQLQQDRAERRAERMFEKPEPKPKTPRDVWREIAKEVGVGFVGGVVGARDDIRDEFTDLFEAIGKVVEKPIRSRLRDTALDARQDLMMLGRQWEQVTNRLERATDRLRDLRSEAQQLRTSVRESIVGGVDVTDAMIERRRSDKDGAYLYEDRSIKAITETLRGERDKARKFASRVERLRKLGLNKRTLQDIIEAGPDEGSRTADEILKGGKGGIRQINVLTRQLNAAGRKLGNSAAESMYGAGIRAAEGLVKGLRQEERQIERIMRRIARSMVRSIKHELEIKSPSRVFARQIGKPAIEGIAVGMLSAESQVLEATRQIIDNAARKPWDSAEFYAPKAKVKWVEPSTYDKAHTAMPVGSGDTYNITGTSEEILYKLESRRTHAKIVRQRPGG